MVMNNKIRDNKNRPAKHSLAWLDHFFHYLWWQKNGKTRSGHARLRMCKGSHGGRLAQCVS